MKKVKIELEDLLIVLEAMSSNGTKEIIIFDYEGVPAICDADSQEDVITFATTGSGEDSDMDEDLH